MKRLRVRVYNVRFGDAILVTFPDTQKDGKIKKSHILFDVGNSLSKEGGNDEVFQPIIENILKVLKGKPLDLYIMTHEHMDHIQGLPYAEKYFYTESDFQLRDLLNTQYAWLTVSAAKDYYDRHPKAEKAKLQFEKDFTAIKNYIEAINYLNSPEIDNPMYLETLLGINNPRRTSDNVEYLRNLARSTYYIHRGIDISDKHPFNEANFEIWAPEEDSSVYYGQYRSPALGITESKDRRVKPKVIDYYPPPGVDASQFYKLVDTRRKFVECLLSIDKAKNNTSIVCCLEWKGWKLLFTGDAEIKSWKIMRDKGVLNPVHFLKVSHHGSHNGTPSENIMEMILPKQNGQRRKRRAVVSTWKDTYKGVPDPDTLKRIYDPQIKPSQRRCDKLYLVNESIPAKLYIDLFFSPQDDI